MKSVTENEGWNTKNYLLNT